MKNSHWNSSQIVDQSGRVVVITGATSGIGKETAMVLAGKNATVMIGARNIAKANSVIKEIKQQYPRANVSVRELDLTSLASVASFAHQVSAQYEKIDVLINNAGIMACPYTTTKDGHEIQIGTNHLGHFALTAQLMPLILKAKDARIVILSSLGHRWGDLDLSDINWQKRKYNTTKAYADSKIANLYFMYELQRRCSALPSGPKVSAAHPGWTSTELQRHTKKIDFMNRFFAQGVDQGALPTLRAGFDEKVSSGDYYGPSRFFEMHGAPIKVSSNKRSHDQDIAEKLWTLSETLTGIKFKIAV